MVQSARSGTVVKFGNKKREIESKHRREQEEETQWLRKEEEEHDLVSGNWEHPL